MNILCIHPSELSIINIPIVCSSNIYENIYIFTTLCEILIKMSVEFEEYKMNDYMGEMPSTQTLTHISKLPRHSGYL